MQPTGHISYFWLWAIGKMLAQPRNEPLQYAHELSTIEGRPQQRVNLKCVRMTQRIRERGKSWFLEFIALDWQTLIDEIVS